MVMSTNCYLTYQQSGIHNVHMSCQQNEIQHVHVTRQQSVIRLFAYRSNSDHLRRHHEHDTRVKLNRQNTKIHIILFYFKILVRLIDRSLLAMKLDKHKKQNKITRKGRYVQTRKQWAVKQNSKCNWRIKS